MDPIPFQIDTSTQGIIRNGVGAQAGNVFLAAWLDGRSAATQPGDAANIAAATIDAVAAGNADPALVAVASASPTSGEAGVTVAFDSTSSKGAFDTLIWDFGDGTTSTLVSPSKTYKNNGTYIARLKLTKGAYSVIDSVVITVGTGGPTGTSSQIGVPLQNSDPIVTGLFINTASVALDFKNLNNDKATITGNFDISQITDALTGKVASISLGGKSFSFNLDAKGQSKSDAGAVPTIAFAIDPAKGIFSFQLAAANMRGELADVGLVNQTISPAQQVTLPISMTIDKLSATSKVGLAYKATLNSAGNGNYAFLGAGGEVSGAFLVTAYSAVESGDSHNFTIKGRLVKPGVYRPAVGGIFGIFLGNYHENINNGLIFEKNGSLTYSVPKIKNGIKKFSIDLNSGIYMLQMVRIPADIASGGTGLPLAKSGTNQTDIDLNLSFQFDLKDNPQLSAGRYIFTSRKNAAAKNWILR